MVRINWFIVRISSYLLLLSLLSLTLFLLPKSTRILFDERLKKAAIVMGGDYFQPQENFSILARFVAPPLLSLGLDMPPPDFNRAALHRFFFQVIASPQSPLPKLNPDSKDFLKPLKGKEIFTNDQFIYAKFNESVPNLKFTGDLKTLKASLSNNPNSAAILRFGRGGASFKPLSPPFPFSFWLGWKENKRLGWTGINAELLMLAENLIAHSQRDYLTRFNTIVIPGAITLGVERTPNYGPLQNWAKGGSLVIGNVFGPVSEDTAAELGKAGINLVNLANDKAAASGSKGLEDALLNLKNAGLKTIGAGFNHEDAAKPFIFTFRDGTKAAVLAYSEKTPLGSLPTFNQAGINSFNPQKLESDLDKLKNAVDLRVVIILWKDKFSPEISPRERALARAAVDKGCDLFVGINPDGIQKGEWYKEKPIAYSVGGLEKGVVLKTSYNFSNLLQVETNRLTDFFKGSDHSARVAGGKNRVAGH